MLLWYHSAVSQWKNCLKKRKLQKDYIHQSDLGKKKYRFSEWWKNQRVSLTGSEAAGSSMAEAAGKYLKNQYLN
jgi:hypothetical protein